MNLVEQISHDMVEALKKGEKDRLIVIRMVKAAMKQEMIDRHREENDELVIDVVNKQIKMRMDSIQEFSKADRQDLVTKNEEEIAVLKKYLPEQLTEEEIDSILDTIFEEVKPTDSKDMGKIMKEVTPKVKGKADMSIVSAKIKERLAFIKKE